MLYAVNLFCRFDGVFPGILFVVRKPGEDPLPVGGIGAGFGSAPHLCKPFLPALLQRIIS